MGGEALLEMGFPSLPQTPALPPKTFINGGGSGRGGAEAQP